MIGNWTVKQAIRRRQKLVSWLDDIPRLRAEVVEMERFDWLEDIDQYEDQINDDIDAIDRLLAQAA